MAKIVIIFVAIFKTVIKTNNLLTIQLFICLILILIKKTRYYTVMLSTVLPCHPLIYSANRVVEYYNMLLAKPSRGCSSGRFIMFCYKIKFDLHNATKER